MQAQSDNYTDRAGNVAQCIAQALEQGHSIIEQADDRLLLDFDDAILPPFGPDLLNRPSQELWKQLDCEVVDQYISRSGNGCHVVLKINRSLTYIERIAIQFALGSDPRRESWAMVYHLASGAQFSFLVKPGLSK